MTAIPEASFTQTCLCGQAFSDVGLFTQHEKGCTRGKKRLFSTLAKAKKVFQAKKAKLTGSSCIVQSNDVVCGSASPSGEDSPSEPL